MTTASPRPALARCLATLACAAALPLGMASTQVTSSTSSAASESAGSSSTSVEKSSDSSSPRRKVAAGDYTIIQMAALPERPGTWRLNLRPAAGGAGSPDGFFLYLPQAVVDKTPLAEGGVVTVRERPYGIELAQAGRQEAFFLVLDDDWHRDLQTRAL